MKKLKAWWFNHFNKRVKELNDVTNNLKKKENNMWFTRKNKREKINNLNELAPNITKQFGDLFQIKFDVYADKLIWRLKYNSFKTDWNCSTEKEFVDKMKELFKGNKVPEINECKFRSFFYNDINWSERKAMYGGAIFGYKTY